MKVATDGNLKYIAKYHCILTQVSKTWNSDLLLY